MAIDNKINSAEAPEHLIQAGGLMAAFYFLLQGCGTLISWNAILNGLDFFDAQFLPHNSYFAFPIAVFIGQALANAFMIKISQIISLTKRIIGSLILLSILLFIIPIITNLLKGEDFGFWIIMGILFVLGFISTVYQSSMSGLTSFFPAKYMSLFLAGTGIAGLIMNGLRAIAIVAFGDGITQIIFYFAFAAVIMIGAMFVHVFFSRSKFFRAHAKLVKVEDNNQEGEALTYGHDNHEAGLMGSEIRQPSFLEIFMQCKLFVIVLLVNYIQTFTFFPGVMMEKNTPQLSADWKLVSLCTVFNLFDVIGKSLAERPSFCKKKIVVSVVIFRFIFAGTFIWQALTDTAPIISSLWFGFINIAAFAFTNGFCTTGSFILGPSEVEGKGKEIAGFLSVIGLTTGITIGTFLALPFANLNPNAN